MSQFVSELSFKSKCLVLCFVGSCATAIPITQAYVSRITLDTQLGYSTGEFQALQLIVLAAFGVVD